MVAMNLLDDDTGMYLQISTKKPVEGVQTDGVNLTRVRWYQFGLQNILVLSLIFKYSN